MAELARQSGVSKKTLSELEHGQKTFLAKAEQKESIAKAFGLTVEEFDRLRGEQ